MNNHVIGDEDDLPDSRHLESESTPESEFRMQKNESPLVISKAFWNLTNETVIARDREGVKFFIKPSTDRRGLHDIRELWIYDVISVDERTTLDFSGVASQTLQEGDQRTELLKRDFENWSLDPNSRSTRESVSKRCIYKKSLKLSDLQNGFYEPTSDLVFYLASSRRVYHHPESVIGKMIRRKQGGQMAFAMEVEIYDRSSQIKDRWLRQGRLAYRISLNRDGALPDGIYITIRGGDGQVNTFQLELTADVTEYGIFETKEEALNKDEESEVRKRNLELEKEIEELKMQSQRESAKTKRQEQIYEREKSERANEKSETEHQYQKEKSKTEHENFREKAEVDRINLRNRQIIEVLKFVPTVITAVTGLILIFTRKKS